MASRAIFSPKATHKEIFVLFSTSNLEKDITVYHPIPVHYTVYIQGVSEGIVNILGGGSMDYSE